MEKIEKYILEVIQILQKSLSHLEHSYNKVQKLDVKIDSMNDSTLEIWESFIARFSRTSDIFLMKYVKAKVKLEDPGFHGTFRDYLNQAEKLEIIDDITTWMKIREIRNIAAHEYSEDNLEKIFVEIRDLASSVLAVKSQLQ